MVSTETARKIALSFEAAEELPHFERTSFRINKKIFATMDVAQQLMCVMLTPIDQSVFVKYDSSVVYPVPNKWGLKGATYVDLKKVRKDMLTDMLSLAYCKAAPEKLAMKYRKD